MQHRTHLQRPIELTWCAGTMGARPVNPKSVTYRRGRRASYHFLVEHARESFRPNQPTRLLLLATQGQRTLSRRIWWNGTDRSVHPDPASCRHAALFSCARSRTRIRPAMADQARSRGSGIPGIFMRRPVARGACARVVASFGRDDDGIPVIRRDDRNDGGRSASPNARRSAGDPGRPSFPGSLPVDPVCSLTRTPTRDGAPWHPPIAGLSRRERQRRGALPFEEGLCFVTSQRGRLLRRRKRIIPCPFPYPSTFRH
jgi:hypothetical protein